MLAVVDKLESIEEMVNKKLASVEMQLRGLRCSTLEPVGGSSGRFKVIICIYRGCLQQLTLD